jgi:hypothetical protein
MHTEFEFKSIVILLFFRGFITLLEMNLFFLLVSTEEP